MGNGRAISMRLASEGARVAVADRDLGAAKLTVATLDEGAGHALQADVAEPEQCRRLVQDAATVLSGLDVVVLNVGVHGGMRLRQQTVEDWDRSIATNARAHWLIAQAALEHMLAAGGGSFVFVSSAAAERSSGLSVAYEASKAAQLAIMRHVAVRFASRRVRSNAVVLGAIDSGMVRALFGGSAEASAGRDAMAPAARQGTPEEVAAVVAFLASPDASYINGAAIPIDGALSAASPLFRSPRTAGD
jgi:NAD(P)-dependent dehydrogenase (short-subunit alcohol dehydrogenase family)